MDLDYMDLEIYGLRHKGAGHIIYGPGDIWTRTQGPGHIIYGPVLYKPGQMISLHNFTCQLELPLVWAVVTDCQVCQVVQLWLLSDDTCH